MVQMVKALYGHPDAGTFWENHCHKALVRSGFESIDRSSWPSCYINPKLNLYLSVYVDDFKMSGDPANLVKGWQLIRDEDVGNLILEDPKLSNLYMGCAHEHSEEIGRAHV